MVKSLSIVIIAVLAAKHPNVTHLSDVISRG